MPVQNFPSNLQILLKISYISDKLHIKFLNTMDCNENITSVLLQSLSQTKRFAQSIGVEYTNILPTREREIKKNLRGCVIQK
jgi:hypothetical protein